MSQRLAAAVVPPNKSMTFTASGFNSSINEILGAPNAICQALPKLFIVRLAWMNWNLRIKQQRVKMEMANPANYKPAAFAKMIGVSAATVSDWESGVIKQISGQYLVKAAIVLGVTPEWLMTGLGDPAGRPLPQYVISDEQRELLGLWAGLFGKQQKEYLRLMGDDIEKNRELIQEIDKKRLVLPPPSD